MTEVQYKTLCKFCDNVLNMDHFGSELIALPWLHVIREHPVFLTQYEELFNKQNSHSFLVFIRKTIVNFLIGFKVIIRNFKNSNRNEKTTLNNSERADYLFISHLINISDAGKQDDFYYSTMPAELLSSGLTCQIALLNHTPFSSYDLENKWGENHVRRFIFRNYIGVLKEFQMLIVSLILSVKLYISINEKREELENNILFQSSLKAFECISNLRLGYQVKQFVKIAKPKFIISTYEGHALERILFAKAREINQEIKCIGYQHALVFKLQHAIRRNLASIYNPDIIFTSGKIGKNQLENSPKLNEVKIDILGSNRGSNKTHEIKPESASGGKRTCLVIPEALPNECDLLFNFSLEYALKNNNINFIWRLHPLMSFESLLKANPRFNDLPSNIILSGQSLEDDISTSEFVLYRGSTAVVKAVLSGLIPIYFSQENEMTIDPLYEQDKGKHVITSVFDLNLVFGLDLKKQDHSELMNYCKSLFTELNVYKLVELN